MLASGSTELMTGGYLGRGTLCRVLLGTHLEIFFHTILNSSPIMTFSIAIKPSLFNLAIDVCLLFLIVLFII